jgi:hypothetical protein
VSGYCVAQSGHATISDPFSPPVTSSQAPCVGRCLASFRDPIAQLVWRSLDCFAHDRDAVAVRAMRNTEILWRGSAKELADGRPAQGYGRGLERVLRCRGADRGQSEDGLAVGPTHGPEQKGRDACFAMGSGCPPPFARYLGFREGNRSLKRGHHPHPPHFGVAGPLAL